MKACIKEIEYFLPKRTVANKDLRAENPKWDVDLLEARTGVARRHIADENETALDLAEKACINIFSKSPASKKMVDALIFCTQSPDHVMPPNSCILHKRLGLPERVMAFDFNLACSGYVYGLALARSLILSGAAGTIMLATADTYSKYIHRRDRSARVLFGDGAAASLIERSDAGSGIIDVQCATSGENYEMFIIPAGGCRLPKSGKTRALATDASGNARTLENIHMDGMGILAFVNEKIPAHVRSVLARNGLTLGDVDLFVFHQASKLALDALERALEIPAEKVFRNMMNIGNTVSASIPIALKDALDNGRASKGDRVLLCGFGVGLSWGTAIVEI